jgi:hypothetical protein
MTFACVLQVCTSSSRSRRLNTLSQTLEECATLLCREEMDLVVREAILAALLERGLHPPDGRELLAELDKACVSVDRSANDRVTKTE